MPEFKANLFLTLAFGVLLGIVLQAAFCLVGCSCKKCSVPAPTGGQSINRPISPGPSP